MDDGGAPVGDRIRVTVVRQQVGLLLLAEDGERPPAGGAVDALTRYLQAPAPGLRPQVGQVAKLAAFEEPFSDVGHAPLDVGFVLGMPRPGRVGQEAPLLAVLQEAAGRPRRQRVSTDHGGREVVQDDGARDAAKEGPGGFQPGDDLLQGLLPKRPDEAVAGEGQDHHEGPDQALAAVSGSSR